MSQIINDYYEKIMEFLFQYYILKRNEAVSMSHASPHWLHTGVFTITQYSAHFLLNCVWCLIIPHISPSLTASQSTRISEEIILTLEKKNVDRFCDYSGTFYIQTDVSVSYSTFTLLTGSTNHVTVKSLLCSRSWRS